MISFKDKLKSGMDEFSRFDGMNIICIGDCYVDEYVYGRVTQISEEAPVPVFVEERCERTPGAMGNVANNIVAMGGDPELLTVVGNIKDLGCYGFVSSGDWGIVEDSTRVTTNKVKFLAGGHGRTYQHVFRYDREIREHISFELEDKLIKTLESIYGYDAIIISDYGNGVVNPNIFKAAIEKANKLQIPITADSRGNILDYREVTTIMPNREEVERNLKTKLNTDKDIIEAGIKLREELNSPAFIIKVGSDGMWLFVHDQEPLHIPGHVVEVADITGAGDTALAMFTLMLASIWELGENNCDFAKAAIMANFAAGLSVQKNGASTVSRDEIRTYYDSMNRWTPNK